MRDLGKTFCRYMVIFSCLSGVLHAQSDGVVFWNKMEIDTGNTLVSEVGTNLNLAGTNWSFKPAMFNDGWDNNSESSYAYANSSDLISSCREGALAFWWVPDDDGDTTSSPANTEKKKHTWMGDGEFRLPDFARFTAFLTEVSMS